MGPYFFKTCFASSVQKLLEFARKQLLLVEFDALVAEPRDHLNRIGRFYGVGDANLDVLPGKHETSGEEERMSCTAKEKMQSFFKEWNDKLRADVRAAQAAGFAPEEEPAFDGFGETSVECLR